MESGIDIDVVEWAWCTHSEIGEGYICNWNRVCSLRELAYFTLACPEAWRFTKFIRLSPIHNCKKVVTKVLTVTDIRRIVKLSEIFNGGG